MHLVELGGLRLLLDCGRVRQRHPHFPPDAALFPFAPAEIDAVILSHAHTDHCGHLPHLLRAGLAGPIYCTSATRDLTALMLASAARLQEQDAFVHRVTGVPNDADAPVYITRVDVEQTIRRCVPLPYGEDCLVGNDVRLRLLDAGHILGSALVVLTAMTGERPMRIAFTGDLGRPHSLLLRPPDPLPVTDLLLCESTYGGRALESVRSAVVALEAIVRQTIERGGKVLIPAFSLGRMQLVAYALGQAMRHGRVPTVPVWIDSPLAHEIARVHRVYADQLARDVALRFAEGDEPIGGPPIRYVHSAEEGQALSTDRGPAVLIAPGGMCEGGRILHHLKQHVDDPRCSIVLVNYQAPHTPGRRLLERSPTVSFHGRKWNKWADVVYLPGFSGHADHQELLSYLAPLAGRTAQVRFVHGEVEAAEALATAARGLGFTDAAVPGRGEAVDLR